MAFGRTGSGKSTLAAVLLRLAPKDAGAVYLHGVNTEELQLATLRRAIAVLPQTPTLFAGTVRFNLDPIHGDEVVPGDVISNILCKVGLREVISNLPQGLYSEISQEGSMLSAGEKQLLCLARALLMTQQSASVLLMDEATSACDDNTDRLVQETIACVSTSVTSIFIAHRLQTISDASRILVLDAGHVVGIGPPEQVLVRNGTDIQLADTVRSHMLPEQGISADMIVSL